jgi:hypothetical protein
MVLCLWQHQKKSGKTMKFPSFYFNWLQKGNPTGKPDSFPELKNKFETSVKGLYCIGDPDNVSYKTEHVPLVSGWASGLLQKDIDSLLAHENKAGHIHKHNQP